MNTTKTNQNSSMAAINIYNSTLEETMSFFNRRFDAKEAKSTPKPTPSSGQQKTVSSV